ncbi:WXG100 family type VII secretion target [Streptomyces sp. NBC_01304]|uniref:WXG100 family type VII secretion target n=1 Tax=Streptomyces sp. NBC_01304 TaxID=2903818 RepID=UPI002E11F197|nr:WXG100 family type VII secretion target [Streptomyces sp. NBC_01304]
MAINDGTMLVTYASLEQAAQEIDRQAKQLDVDLDALQSRMKSLSGFFEGEAKLAADKMHGDWDGKAKEIHAALTSLSTQIRQGSEAYKSADLRSAAEYH